MTVLPSSPKLITLTLGLVIFAWSILFIWQGLDFTDEGFYISTYQQFYSAPTNNIFGFQGWLSYFLAHWLGEILGGTILSFRLAASLTIALTGVIAYQGLKLVFGQSWVLASFVFITFLFASSSTGKWINPNILTGLFNTLGALLLFKGLQCERGNWIALAGLVFGTSLFIRFPNVLCLGLVTAVILQGLLQHWHWRRTLRLCLMFVGGYILGISLIAMTILLHGHIEFYSQSLRVVLDMGLDDNSHHSLIILIKGILQDYIFALVLSVLVLAGCLITEHVLYNRPIWLQIFILSLATACLILAYKPYDSWKWAVPGVLYLGLLWIIVKEWQSRPHLVLLSFIALSVLALTPMGSTSGIRNSIFGQWIALPLLLIWLWQGGANIRLPFLQTSKNFRLALMIFLISLVGHSLISSWYYTYRDSSNRLILTETIDHPFLFGIHTTPERAKVVKELLEAMANWSEPGDALLAYPDIPAIHYLTKTYSWIGNPWPILYQTSKILPLLNNKQAQSQLPVVVRSLGATRNRTWPLNSRRNETPKREAAWRTFDQFTKDHGYVIVWKNDFFEILATDLKIKSR